MTSPRRCILHLIVSFKLLQQAVEFKFMLNCNFPQRNISQSHARRIRSWFGAVKKSKKANYQEFDFAHSAFLREFHRQIFSVRRRLANKCPERRNNINIAIIMRVERTELANYFQWELFLRELQNQIWRDNATHLNSRSHFLRNDDSLKVKREEMGTVWKLWFDVLSVDLINY